MSIGLNPLNVVALIKDLEDRKARYIWAMAQAS